MEAIKSVALDSAPPIRRRAYDFLREQRDVMGYQSQKTSQVARAVKLPTNTVRRILEDLTAYDLVDRTLGGKRGKADLWTFKP
jgi:predicted ArsR family transcriptional regulator